MAKKIAKTKTTVRSKKKTEVKKQGRVQALFSKVKTYASQFKSYLNRETKVSYKELLGYAVLVLILAAIIF